ncbi:MAG: tail fiber domain-containing protein [Firmicutes bacterium]|jgi:hypothetical protein|nr:tail fiber domain-containing protein [Bacillota bacterium]
MLNLDPKRYDLAIKQLMKAMESSDKIMTNQINVVNSVRQELGDFKSVYADEITGVLGQFEILRSDVADVNVLVANCANIDFSNIGKAAMEHLYAESGLIRDVVVGDQRITGELVGVTISGDLIKGNTILAEKLVIKGEDGLYHRLNTDGAVLETEQTDHNSLNGSVIMAQSIAANKIAVEDLSAFEATIGGFTITKDAIYSGVKDSVDNTTRGTYLDKEGQLAIGDSNNYIKYHKGTDGQYKLDISAESVTFKATHTKDRNYVLVSKGPRVLPGNSNTWNQLRFDLSDRITSGTELTISFDYAISPAASYITIYIYKSTTENTNYVHVPISTASGKFKHTFTVENTFDATYDLIIYAGHAGTDTGKTLTVSNVKLEKGSVATAWSPAPEDAFTCATNYLNFDTSGLVVGDFTTGTLGRNVLVGSDGVYIRNGTTTLAYFKENSVSLGVNSEQSTIYLCSGNGRIAYHSSSYTFGSPLVATTPVLTTIKALDVYSASNVTMTTPGKIVLDAGDLVYVDGLLRVKGAIECGSLGAKTLGTANVNAIQFNTNSARIYAPVNGTNHNMFDITGSSMWLNYSGWASNTCSANYGGSTIFLESKNQIYFDYAIGSTSDRIVMDHAYSAGCLRPNVDSRSTCGYAGYKWYRVYNYTSACTTSDARDKYDVTPIAELGANEPEPCAARRVKAATESNDNVLERLYAGLIPKVFRKKKEVKDQIHVGFVAQDVGSALEEMGLDEEHFGFLIHDSWSVEERDENGEIMTDENGNPVMNEGEEYGLAYEEFIALNTYMIQKQQKTMDALTRRVDELEKGA